MVDLPTGLAREMAEAPDPDLANANFDRMSSAVGNPSEFYSLLDERPALGRVLLTILGGSTYLSDIMVRDPAYFFWLVASPDVLGELREGDYYKEELLSAIEPDDDQDGRRDAIRRLARHRQRDQRFW